VNKFSGCLRNSSAIGLVSSRYFSVLDGSMKAFITTIIPAAHEEVVLVIVNCVSLN